MLKFLSAFWPGGIFFFSLGLFGLCLLHGYVARATMRHVQAVLGVLGDAHPRALRGLDIAKLAGVPQHSIYRFLRALEQRGLVESQEVDGSATAERGWLPYRIYWLREK